MQKKLFITYLVIISIILNLLTEELFRKSKLIFFWVIVAAAIILLSFLSQSDVNSSQQPGFILGYTNKQIQDEGSQTIDHTLKQNQIKIYKLNMKRQNSIEQQTYNQSFKIPTQVPENLIDTHDQKYKTQQLIGSILIQKNLFQRYCRECGLVQKIRTKHCKICQRCVATYDHHCPWLNNCIGQKNKFYFILLLILICLIMVIGIYQIIISIKQHYQFNKLYLLIIMTLLGLLIFFLLIFHFVIVFYNLTTWEYYSWQKISYMTSSKSPFQTSIISSIILLWFYPLIHKDYINWQTYYKK